MWCHSSSMHPRWWWCVGQTPRCARKVLDLRREPDGGAAPVAADVARMLGRGVGDRTLLSDRTLPGAVPAAAAPISVAPERTARTRIWPWAAAALGVALVLAAALTWYSAGDPQATPAGRAGVPLPTPDPVAAQPMPPAPAMTLDMPNLVKLRAAEALVGARRFGLEVVLADHQTRRELATSDGLVVAQSPSAGTAVRRGERAELMLSALNLTVPKVVDMNLSAALTTLTRNGFTLGKTQTVEVRNAKSGFIVSQSPPPGVPAARGQEVDVVVGAPALPSPRGK